MDRLGRDAIDVQATVKRLVDAKVAVDVNRAGLLAGDTAKLILALLAQLAEMERTKIGEQSVAVVHCPLRYTAVDAQLTDKKASARVDFDLRTCFLADNTHTNARRSL